MDMSSGPESIDSPRAADWQALKDAVRQFESAWREGRRSPIENFLPPEDPLRSRVLLELVHIELELRLKAGEPARVEEYLARSPELTNDCDNVLELIVAEHALRRRSEPAIAIDEFLERFPHFRCELSNQLAPSTV